MKQEELFEKHGGKVIKLAETTPECFPEYITLEQLYQAFKARMLAEQPTDTSDEASK